MKKPIQIQLPSVKIGQEIGSQKDHKWTIIEELGKGVEGVIFKGIGSILSTIEILIQLFQPKEVIQ
jgi:hypothetical protein